MNFLYNLSVFNNNTTNSVGDFLLRPKKWCTYQWRSDDTRQSVIQRIALIVPTIFAHLVGEIGMILKTGAKFNRCLSERVFSSSQIYSNIQELKKNVSNEQDLTKDEALKVLKETYNKLLALKPKSKVDQALVNRLGIQLLGRLGIRTYPNFDQSLMYLLASLKFQSASETRLIELEKIGEFKAEFQQNFLALFEKNNIFSKGLPLTNGERIQYAETLTTLAYCYLNLKEGSIGVKPEEFLVFKEKLYSGIKDLFLTTENTAWTLLFGTGKETKNVRNQLAEVQYNLFPNLYLDKIELKEEIKKEHVDKFCEILDETLHFNSSNSMLARMANLKACTYFDVCPSEAERYLKLSCEFWGLALAKDKFTAAEREKAESNRDNAMGNVLALLLKQENPSKEDLDRYSAASLSFYEKNKDGHPYSMSHLLKLAQVQFKMKNKIECVKYIQLFDEIAEKYATWPDTNNYIVKAGLLKMAIYNMERG